MRGYQETVQDDESEYQQNPVSRFIYDDDQQQLNNGPKDQHLKFQILNNTNFQDTLFALLQKSRIRRAFQTALVQPTDGINQFI
jgi:hypothetical protein